MYMALLAVPERERFDTSALKLAASGGASLPVEVLRGVEEAFGITLLEGYGLSGDLAAWPRSTTRTGRPRPARWARRCAGSSSACADENDAEVETGRDRRDRDPRRRT